MVVPKEFRKTLCLSAGWISLLEAVVFEAVCVYIIGSYDCAWDFLNLQSGVTTWSMLDITYFMGQCKGDVGALKLGYLMSPPARPASNLQVWLWIYAVVTAAWVPACILLIVSAMGEVRGRQAAMLYYPWISLTTTLVFIDLAGAIYHLVDVFRTTTPDDYATFTGVTNWNILTINASSAGITSWLPSLIVTLFFCRCLLLWLLNIFFIYGTYKASNAVSVYKTKFIQNTDEKKKSWREKFHDGPEPSSTEQQSRNNVTSVQAGKTEDVRLKSSVNMQQDTRFAGNEATNSRYRVDEFGIPVEELITSEPREIKIKRENSGVHNPNEENFSRLPYQPTERVFDFTGRPVKPESINDRWQDNAPPMASGVQVPPELNKFEPFSYTAGDQPQLMRRPVSRSNSKSKPEYPPIPRPDYTVADRSSASLEYVPNRFKVPSPKRSSQLQSTFTYESPGSPRSPKTKVAPVPPRKPVIYPRSTPPIPEDPVVVPQVRYISQTAIPSQQQPYYTRQTSTSNSFNINRLY